jgi:hypothetical protein
MAHAMWDYLGQLAAADPTTAFTIANRIIRAELNAPYPHISLRDTGPVLRAALTRGAAEVVQAARDVIDLLGEQQFTEFGRLLSEGGAGRELS